MGVGVSPKQRLSKRIVFLVLLAIALGVGFWSGSRYPDLDEKAVMGGDTLLEDPLSFEAMIQFEPHAPAWKRVGYTTLNWIDTNKRGMAFGLGIGNNQALRSPDGNSVWHHVGSS